MGEWVSSTSAVALAAGTTLTDVQCELETFAERKHHCIHVGRWLAGQAQTLLPWVWGPLTPVRGTHPPLNYTSPVGGSRRDAWRGPRGLWTLNGPGA